VHIFPLIVFGKVVLNNAAPLLKLQIIVYDEPIVVATHPNNTSQNPTSYCQYFGFLPCSTIASTTSFCSAKEECFQETVEGFPALLQMMVKI